MTVALPRLVGRDLAVEAQDGGRHGACFRRWHIVQQIAGGVKLSLPSATMS